MDVLVWQLTLEMPWHMLRLSRTHTSDQAAQEMRSCEANQRSFCTFLRGLQADCGGIGFGTPIALRAVGCTSARYM